jgi:Ca-activated chloride channel family protein
LAKTLGKEFFGTIYTIAKDVKLQIEFNPSKVKAYRLIGYENRMLNKEDFNDDKKDAGDIGAGHTVTALYEIIPAGSKEEVPGVDELEYQKTKVVKSDDIMTLKLRYKEPDASTSKLIKHKITEEDLKKDLSTNFKWAVAVTEFGLLLRDSQFKGKANFENVIAMAKEAKGSDPEGYRAEFIKLAEVAELLKK